MRAPPRLTLPLTLLAALSVGVAASGDAAAAPQAIAPVRVDAPQTPLEPTATATATATAKRHRPGALEVALEAEAVWRLAREGARKDGAIGNASRDALITAAKARAELGHVAHAVAYLEAALADGHASPDAERMIDELSAALVPVDIVVDADPRDSAITVEVDFYGRPSDVLPPLIVQLEREEGREGIQRKTVLLTPGRWNVAIPEDGYYDYHDTDIEVVAGGASPNEVEITLRADVPVGDRPAFIGLRAASSPFFMGAVGVGLLSGGQVQYRRALSLTDDDCVGDVRQCREILSQAVTLRSVGTGLLGASLGVGTALLSGLAPTRRQRAIVWGIEGGVGLAAVVGGALGVSFAAGAFNELPATAWEDPAYRDAATQASARYSGYSFALGYGTSLLVYSVYYLLRDQLNAHVGMRKRRRDRGRVFAVTPGGGPGPLGGGVVGRF
ncbi:MAG: hypothetical protein R3A79_22380 [Nannocystaceae bacterium]